NWSAVPPPRPFGRRRRLRKEDPLARSNVRRNAQGNRPTCPRQNADAGSVGQDAADGRERLPCPKTKAAGFLHWMTWCRSCVLGVSHPRGSTQTPQDHAKIAAIRPASPHQEPRLLKWPSDRHGKLAYSGPKQPSYGSRVA